MEEKIGYSEYHKSIAKLNKLKRMSYTGKERQELIKHRLTYTMNMCKKLEIREEDLDKLNIIHITGSKGKGSTCAFIESILRSKGFKTGLINSPHLIEYKERVKINGKPLSYYKFRNYFDYCYNLLVVNKTKEDEFEKAYYYQFLTVLAFYIFTQENIDVAIVEVGIGGEYDFTNIIPNPIACGITSLQLDHCDRLGNTIEEIAWHKAGILKSSCIGFTIESNIDQTLKIIKERADQLNIPLCLAPTINKITDLQLNNIELGLKGDVQLLNSSLAIQIAKYWIEKRNNSYLDRFKWVRENTINGGLLPILRPFRIDDNFKNGLEKCIWPGRNQIIETKNKNVTYYIDGAHTNESIEQFVNWFKKLKKNKTNKEKNVLLFNYTGDRDSIHFLEILSEVNFDNVAFAKLIPYPNYFENSKLELAPKVSKEKNLSKYFQLVETYKTIMSNLNKSINEPRIFENIFDSLVWLTDHKDPGLLNQIKSDIQIDDINNLNINENDFSNSINEQKNEEMHTNVLITGSLYLVGLTLEVLNFQI